MSWILNNILNQKGSPAIFTDTLANRPTAGYTGRLFVSSDTFAWYRDNGSGWDLIGGPGSGTITGTLTANRVAYATGSNTIATSANLLFDGTTLTTVNDIVVNGLFIGKGGGNVAGNSALGLLALENNTTGTANTAIGNAALRTNTTGTNNIAVGTNALLQNNSNFNTAVGAFAVPSATGGFNTAIGANTLQTLFGGTYNIAVGYNAGGTVETGTENIFIGANTIASSASASNQIVIGYGAAAAAANTVVIGNNNIVTTYLKGELYLGGGNADIDYIINAKSATPYGVVIENTELVPSSNAILLLRSNTGTSVSTRHIFTNNGRLGVGTDIPLAIIDILGDSLTNGSNQKIGMFRSGATTFLDIVQANNDIVAGQNILGTTLVSSNVLAFASSNVERMRLSSGGALLIGGIVDNGLSIMQVSGSVYINGDLGLGVSPLTGGGNAKWVTTDAVSGSTYGGGLISSINGVAKGYVYSDNGFMRVQAQSGEGVRLVTNSSTIALDIASSGAITASSSVTTGAPSGGTAAAWKLGSYVAVAAPAPTGYIEIDIAGTLYKIAAGT